MNTKIIAEFQGNDDTNACLSIVGPPSGKIMIEASAWMDSGGILSIKDQFDECLGVARVSDFPGYQEAYLPIVKHLPEGESLILRLILNGVWTGMPAMRVTDGFVDRRLIAEHRNI